MIPIYQPYLTEREQYYVHQAISTGWISSRGDFIEEFEARLASLLDVKHAITVHNGTVSLMLILAALDLPKNTYVFVPSLTYVASASPAYWLGHKIVLFDSDDQYQPSIDSLKAVFEQAYLLHKISNSTPFSGAIILPQLYGNCPDMEKFIAFGQDNNLLVIEDSAEVFGCSYMGRMLGTLGVAGSFSFFGNKTITTGEGGLVVTSDDLLAEKMRSLRSHAHVHNFEHSMPAFNFRMTNIQAGIGLGQLDNYSEIVKRKMEIASFYRSNLPTWFKSIIPNQHIESTEWMPIFQLPEEATYIDFHRQMQTMGVDTRPCFMPMHLQSGFVQNSQFIVLPNTCMTAEDIYKRGFNLPCYPALENIQLEYIVECLEKVTI